MKVLKRNGSPGGEKIVNGQNRVGLGGTEWNRGGQSSSATSVKPVWTALWDSLQHDWAPAPRVGSEESVGHTGPGIREIWVLTLPHSSW